MCVSMHSFLLWSGKMMGGFTLLFYCKGECWRAFSVTERDEPGEQTVCRGDNVVKCVLLKRSR